MAENVFILGAGASADAGAPLMGDFLDRAEDFLRRSSTEIDTNAFNDVFTLVSELESVYAKSNLDLNNIEALFGAIEMGSIINKLGRRTDAEILTSRESLVKLIVQTLEKSIKYPVKDRDVLPTRSYQRFAEFIKERLTDTSIITFNYDIALDFALHTVGMQVDYGLDAASADNGIMLLKLHGSLNWAQCSDEKCRKIIPYSLATYMMDFGRGIYQDSTVNPYTSESEVQIVLSKRLKQQLTCSHSSGAIGVEDLPVIVPPTWNKTQYHGNLTNVWRTAAKELATARNIYVIGYSLPESDAFFRYLFALGVVGQSRIQKFWVFDPDTSGKTEARYKGLLGEGIRNRFQYFPHQFNMCLELLKRSV